MATEIELKAHVADHQTLKLLLSEKAEYLGAFEKEDTYWTPVKGSLRTRSEKRILADGNEKSTNYICYKRKEVRDGIEINDELEFEAKPGEIVKEFFREMGLEPWISKRKRGWAYFSKEINAELVEVEGLGWFVELEIIADNDREVCFKEAKNLLLDFLFSLGIEEKHIESRFYTEMLLILKNDTLT